MKQENLRMMEIAEQQRILASKKYDQEMEVERLKKKKQATELMEQIKENEITREFEAARTADVRTYINKIHLNINCFCR